MYKLIKNLKYLYYYASKINFVFIIILRTNSRILELNYPESLHHYGKNRG